TQLAEMLPGFSKLVPSAVDGGEGNRMRKMEAIILSMTPEERHNPTIINGSRRRRIAQGSGTTTRDVNQLLNQFHQIQKLTKMVAKGGLPKNLMRMLGQSGRF
ncbi:MAG: signal recognition particle protein, partial [Dehalococcoidia bacterium]|nr:signal recognition particle protein [Dehalococcoidia bacterium]